MSSTMTAESTAAPAAIIGMREQLFGLLDVLWAARSPKELLDSVVELEKARSTLDAVELTLVNEIQATAAGRNQGWGSTTKFLEAVSGQFQGTGGPSIRLAEALDGEFVRVKEDLARGFISRPQAQVIVRAVKRLPLKRVIREQAIDVLLELARELDATDLKQATKYLIEVVDPDGAARDEERNFNEKERAAHRERFLSLVEDGFGGVRIKGRATVEAAAIIKKALMSLSAPVTTDPGACGGDGSCTEAGCAHDGKDVRDHGARMMDAWVEACRRLMGTDVLPKSHGSSPRLTVTMDLENLRNGVGMGTVDTGQTLSASAVRRLACDCELIPAVLGSEGEILDVGRAQRLVTMAMWTALVLRDGECAFPGCHAPPVGCDAHHILHWLHGGATALENLVLLCRAHHTTIHNSPWDVQLNPVDHRPEFLPPAHLDPERKPIRRRRPRQE
jgi:hypothetical protein